MGTAAIIAAIENGLPALIALFNVIHGGNKTQIAASAGNAVTSSLQTLADNSKGGQKSTVAAIIPLATVLVQVAVDEFEPASVSASTAAGTVTG